MKEIFETYKTPELRFLVRQHNKKVRAVVREEVKGIRQSILKKRLIDLRYKKRPEIINKLIENKKFFRNLKKRPDDFNIKKSKTVQIKPEEIKKEMKKEIAKEEKKVEKKVQETPEEAEERLKEFKERLKLKKKKKKRETTIETKKTGKENPTVKKLLGGKKVREKEIKRIGAKSKRFEETAAKLLQLAKEQKLTERERSGVNKIEVKIDDGSVTAKEIEKLKRVIKKYEGKVPELPKQQKLKNIQNTIASLRKQIREIKEPKLKKANEAKLEKLIEEKEKLRAEKKEEKKKTKAKEPPKPKPKPKKAESAKEKEFKKIVAEASKEEDEEEAVLKIDELIGESDIEFSQADFNSMEKETIKNIKAKEGGLKLTIEPVKKKAPPKKKAEPIKKNPDVIPFFQIDNKTQSLVLKALPKAEGFDKEDQKDLSESIIEKVQEITEGRDTLEGILKDFREDEKNEKELFEYMFKNKLGDKLQDLFKKLEKRQKADADYRKEIDELNKKKEAENLKEQERIKKSLGGKAFTPTADDLKKLKISSKNIDKIKF